MADAAVEFTMDYQELGKWLRTSPDLHAYLDGLGRRGVAYAQSIAPVGSRSTSKTTPGQYRDSVRYEVTVGRRRMYLRIYSTDFTAWWVEYGSKKVPRHAVLRRTLDFLRLNHSLPPADYAGIAEYDMRNIKGLRRRVAQRTARARKAGH